MTPAIKPMVTDEMVYAAMMKADEMDLHLDDIDAREFIDAALSALAPQPTAPDLMRHMPDSETLMRQIEADPDAEVEAGKLHPEASVGHEPRQEVVVWRWRYRDQWYYVDDRPFPAEPDPDDQPLYTHPSPQPSVPAMVVNEAMVERVLDGSERMCCQPTTSPTTLALAILKWSKACAPLWVRSDP